MERITEQKEAEEMFLRELERHIDMVKEEFSKLPKPFLNDHIIEEMAISIVEDFLYSNHILHYKYNLIDEENQREFNITKIDAENIEKEFEVLFKKCNQEYDLHSVEEDIDSIDSHIYHSFKEKLNKICKNGCYTLLIELEKFINLPACEDRINKFKKEARTQGRELKRGIINGEGGSPGISLGLVRENEEHEFEGDDEYENYDP